ncbi:MAG: lamin tail domain-containing protein, partial [Erysipelotrichaceae bacterium]|nr:lamin tail domain-containing protein [Erysipelotrichaceae bacterium]
MKSRVKQTEKFDGLFVIGTILVVVAAIVASTLFGGLSPVPSGDLPDREGNNIHKLVISELMSNNGGVWVNDQNEVVDYLEVYNGTDKTINLQGYGLSDRTDTIKWVFSDVTIPSGGYVTVGLTGRLQTGNNAPFRLSSKGGETISLINPSSKVIDAVETVSLGKNQAMMRDGDGNWFVSDFGTPGFANTRKGLEDYHASLIYDGEKELVINEFLNRNKANFLRNGRQDGFIEFKNVSDHSVDLGEYTIGKDITNPFLQKLESHVIASGEVLCIYTGDQKEDLGF